MTARDRRMEQRLIEQARAGDRRAQEALWDAHRRWVAAIILAHRPRTAEVEDLMQEAAVKLISKVGTLREVSAFRPWLRQIIVNLCRGEARGRKARLRLASEGPGEEGEGDRGQVRAPASREEPADVSSARREAAGRLLEQALTLPPEYREPLLLRCVRSLSYQQIGEILGLPVTTVETRLARARRMLREEVGEIVADEASS